MAGIGAGMQRWAGRVALVTGASTGMGQALARALTKHGMRVVGCAKDVETMEDDARSLSKDRSIPGSLDAVKCDLAREDEILKMFAEIKRKYGGVDVCVCNAGFNHAGTLTRRRGILDGETAKWQDMLDVNVLAVAICSREAVKQMEERGVTDGQLLVTNSLGGHRLAGKDNHFYGATKHAVTVLVEGIRRELREKETNIRVAQISPGVVDTDFHRLMYANADPAEVKELYKSFRTLKPEDVVDSMLHILQAPPHIQVHDILVRPTEQKN